MTLARKSSDRFFILGKCEKSLAARDGPLGACPSNRCSNPSESDSSLDYEQALRPWNIDQTLLLPPNVRDFVPKDHVSRFIVGLVRESLDLKAITGSYGSGLGQDRKSVV